MTIDTTGFGLVIHAEYERQAAEDEINYLRGMLLEAAELIVEWGTYADMYFQEKWGLAADAARIRAAGSGDRPAT